MARRSGRITHSGNAGHQHKRALSASSSGEALTKKPKRAHSTTTRSKHFTEPDNEEDETDDEGGIQFRKGSAKTTHDSPEAEAAWKPGVKAGIGPGTQVIIKKPKARPAGKIPYRDDTIHPNTLSFLTELKENNRREWLKFHDSNFRQAEKDWHTFVEKMTETLGTIDDTIPELPVKDVIFRIYRDIRFSKDPTPYKAWFSVAWSRAGRKGPYAHYYVQCAPNKSFVGGGLWHPDAAPVAAMRRAIDRHPRRLKDVLLNPLIRKEFLKNAPANDKAVVEAFVESNRGNMLKTKPKGYDSEHPDIDLLRLRNYTIGRDLADENVLGEAGRRRIAELLAAIQPFITYLNSVVMPDQNDESEDATENGESSSEEEGEGVEQHGESGEAD